MNLDTGDHGHLLAQVVQLPAEQRGWTVRYVAGHPSTADAAELAWLLAMLGLDPLEGRTHGRSGPTHGIQRKDGKQAKKKKGRTRRPS